MNRQWCDYCDRYHYPPPEGCVLHSTEVVRIEVDPTELRPGDVVLELNDHDISGCHCDVRVTVERERLHE